MSNFLYDDYDELDDNFFLDLRINRSYSADPSGWFNIKLESSELLPPRLNNIKGLQNYYSDEKKYLGNIKQPFIELVSAWDRWQYSYEDITLCNSVTSAISIVLSTLKRKGIKTIFFETPLYFATICQARSFEFRTHFVPTYLEYNFSADEINDIIKRSSGKFAIWISQPRTYLGFNQDYTWIYNLMTDLPRDCFLIIDEALEQDWPSTLHKISGQFSNLIRLRSVTKGIGLNGLKIAIIIHSKNERSEITSSMENFQGGMDLQSIILTTSLITNISLFERLLFQSKKQVSKIKMHAKIEVLGSHMVLSDIQNGYIGSIALPRPQKFSNITKWRKHIINYCVNLRCPIILGSSMYFPVHDDYEFIRLTYFNEMDNIINGIRIFKSIYEDEVPPVGWI